MRAILFFLFIILLVTGCIPRTQTQIPAFSGTVIDADSRKPLAGVTITEQAVPAPEDWSARTFLTDTDGRFDYPAVTSGTVFQLMAPGAGWPVSRALTFQKAGYQSMICIASDMSLFGQEHNGIIPLIPGTQQGPTMFPDALIRGVGEIVCQAVIGSQVVYEGQSYRIETITKRQECDFEYLVFSLVSETGERVEITELEALTIDTH